MEGEFVTRDEDLAGFWDMVFLQIEDIQSMFKRLNELRSNQWKIEAKQGSGLTATSKTPSKKTIDKKKLISTPNTSKSVQQNDKSVIQSNTSKLRAEAARQRLQEAKRNAMKQKESLSSVSSELKQNIDVLDNI
jgi:hypothetical protein